MIGATATEDGTAGLVPPPPKGTIKRYLRADGIWCPPNGGDAVTVGGKTADDLLDYRNATNTPTIPTSLPANGGNADTLGNSVSARYILNNSANYQKIFSLIVNRYQNYPTTINVKTGREVSNWFDFCTYPNGPSSLRYLSRIPLDAINKGTISLYTSFVGGQTWDFYIRSSEAYGGVNVAVLGTQTGVVFKNEGVSSLPEGYVAAT